MTEAKLRALQAAVADARVSWDPEAKAFRVTVTVVAAEPGGLVNARGAVNTAKFTCSVDVPYDRICEALDRNDRAASLAP